MIEIDKIRSDFPILKRKIYDKPLIYLDNAATTQKPESVITCISEFYKNRNSNVHRGVHFLSEQANIAYEDARKTIRRFINAKSDHEIIFTKGTTEAINLIADSFGNAFLKENDEIIITEMEHHANIIPWQVICNRKRAKLKVLPFNALGALLMEHLPVLISDRTKLLAICHVSNVLGTINPVQEIVRRAHASNIPVLIDAAQSVSHLELDVQELDCDFLMFSGHKMYAETGIGVLYGKEQWLERLPPYQTGGGMIKHVSFEHTSYAELPFKFEAGTPNFVGAISLASAVDYIQMLGHKQLTDYETDLIRFAFEQLSLIDGLVVYGNLPQRCGVVSFNLDGVHPYDAGMLLDKLGIAVRTGTHCAEPTMQHYGIEGTIRASVAIYNTYEEIAGLITGIKKIKQMLK